MRLSIIDLGSNSVRFDVYQLYGNLDYQKLYSEKLMIKLGKDVFSQGYFSKPTIHNTVQVFKHFNQICQSLGVDQTYAYATAAVRQAKNKKLLINAVFKNSSIKLIEISGHQEAKIIYQGLKQHINQPQQQNFICVDIGGGSTEITLNNKSKVFHHSIPLGSSLIKEQFIKSSPPSTQELQLFQDHITGYLKKHLAKWPKVSSLEAYGSSGTVKGIVKVLNSGDYIDKKCSPNSLSKLIKKTSTYSYEQLKKVPYLEEKRIDMFTGGNILLDEILKFFNCASLRYTDIALKEGLLNLTLKTKKTKYVKVQNIDFSSSFFKHHILSPYQRQSLVLFNKLFKKLLDADKDLINLSMIALVIGLICNSKKPTYRFSDYQALAQDFPFYNSKNDYSSIVSIFKLMLEMTAIKPQKKETYTYKKIAIALKLFLWCFDKNPQWIKNYKISKKTFLIKIPITSFLQQKQFDQIKKSFEELFDLKIKLL
ncbi:MAG TPA: hypothetical protein PKC21_00710 [Oligoflexia bacterium]|nr:hypothetical protein [Oligoflexia bacterium]HMR23849.1 hypothetical protein [Oligoflexia bacterium]